MSEILRKRLNESVGKHVTVFLHNNFRYSGRITGCDNEYLEILDTKTDAFKIINLNEIKDMEVER